MNAAVMRRVLEYARRFGLPVIAHCEDLNLRGSGVMHEGAHATCCGLPGSPAAAETAMVARDIELARLHRRAPARRPRQRRRARSS